MKNLVFKDQPWGKCRECKWNEASGDEFHCTCPLYHLRNLYCMLKTIMVLLKNIEECNPTPNDGNDELDAE